MLDENEFQQLYDDIVGLQTNKAILEYRREQFALENKDLYEALDELEARIDERKRRITAYALKEYQRTGKKKLLHGLGIREVAKVSYDKETAFAWAIEHGLALSLDTKKFEAIAKASKPNFVTIVTEDTVTFPTNHDKLLEG